MSASVCMIITICGPGRSNTAGAFSESDSCFNKEVASCNAEPSDGQISV